MSDLKGEEAVSAENRQQEAVEPDNSQIFKNLEQFTAKNNNSLVIMTILSPQTYLSANSFPLFLLQILATAQSNPPTIHDFHSVKAISKGGYGKVYLGYKKSKPSQLYAIKVRQCPSSSEENQFRLISGDEQVQYDKQEHGLSSCNRAECVGAVSVSFLREALLLLAVRKLSLLGDGVHGRW